MNAAVKNSSTANGRERERERPLPAVQAYCALKATPFEIFLAEARSEAISKLADAFGSSSTVVSVYSEARFFLVALN